VVIQRVFLAVVVLAQTAILFTCSRQDFVTVDETGHIPAGIAHWQSGSFDLYRVNPPLARMIASLPVLLAHPNIDYRQSGYSVGARAEWSVGQQFEKANASQYFELYCLARTTLIGWAVVGALLVYKWGQELFGSVGSYIALTLWCFEPNLLAHGHLATADFPATVSCMAATYAFWRYLQAPSWFRAWLAGLVLGVALLLKFTALVLYPIFVVLWLIDRLARKPALPGGQTLRRGLAQCGCIVLLSVVTVNLGYGFKDTCLFLRDYPFVSELLGGKAAGVNDHGNPVGANRFTSSWIGWTIIPLPADYVRGIDEQRSDFEAGLPSYLAGTWQHHGWWYYYLYALAVKLPLGTIVLAIWGVGLAFKHSLSRDKCLNEATILVPALGIMVLVSSQTGFNHHIRYVLPMFPFMILATGKLGSYIEARRLLPSALVISLILLSVASTIGKHPHYISYFNEAVGGPNHGDDHLLDSNIDWGQDLLFLRDWLDRHPEAQPIGLAYWNLVDPTTIGISYHLPPLGPHDLFPGDENFEESIGPHPGYYAISVNYLRGAWTLYPPDGRGGRARTPPATFEYFRRFKPIAKAGYSIFVYHVSPDEANEVRQKLGLRKLK
jgi:4-amino-4-deoxy-L-arabinose transferase-like glycosyltransferase